MSSWQAKLFYKELQQKDKGGAWMCSSLLGSLSRSSGWGQEDCFLFICSLSYSQSSLYTPSPDLGDIQDALCKNRGEQLNQLHLTDYIIGQWAVWSLTCGGLCSFLGWVGVKVEFHRSNKHFIVSGLSGIPKKDFLFLKYSSTDSHLRPLTFKISVFITLLLSMTFR